MQPELVARPAAQGQRQIGPVAEGSRAAGAAAQRSSRIGPVRHQDRDQALAIGDEIVPVEQCSFALAGAPLAERQQPAEPAIGGAVGRIDQQRRRRRSGRAGSRRSARTPVTLAASCARTMPASELRSVTPSASIPSRAACGEQLLDELDAPRRNEKCDVTCSSA